MARSLMLPSELYTSVEHSSVARLKMRASYSPSASSPPRPSVSRTTTQHSTPASLTDRQGAPHSHNPRVHRCVVGPTLNRGDASGEPGRVVFRPEPGGSKKFTNELLPVRYLRGGEE